MTERWSPEPNHTGALLKLRAIVEEESGCRFVIAVFGDSVYRDRLIDYFATLMERSRVLDIDDTRDFETFDEVLTKACGTASLVHVTGAGAWLSDEDHAAEFLHGLNYRRERLAARCGSTVVFWLDELAVQRVAQESPDFWAWRAGLLSFVSETRPPPKITEERVESGRVDERRMQRRLRDLRSYISQLNELHPSRVLLFLEMSEIEKNLGELDEAERSAFEAKRLAAHYNDRLNEAVGWNYIADIRETRGEFDEALRIRREEMLPVYERLGDVRERAVTMGKIADLLQARGELDQAVEMYKKSLALNEMLGRKEGMAIDYGNLGNVYQTRGELDRAVTYWQRSLSLFSDIGSPNAATVQTWLDELGSED